MKRRVELLERPHRPPEPIHPEFKDVETPSNFEIPPARQEWRPVAKRGNDRLPFAELVGRFNESPERRDITHKTLESYRVAFEIVTEVLGADIPVADINRESAR